MSTLNNLKDIIDGLVLEELTETEDYLKEAIQKEENTGMEEQLCKALGYVPAGSMDDDEWHRQCAHAQKLFEQSEEY